MKNIQYTYILLFIFICYGQLSAQVKVGDNPTTMHTSAIFEIESTSKGLLPPRMNEAQMNAINTPADGLIVFCTNCDPIGFYFWDGTNWSQFTRGGNALSADCSANGLIGDFNGEPTFSATITNNKAASAPLTFSTNNLSFSGIGGMTVEDVSPTTATLSGGASQLVTYTLGGSPDASGILNIDLNILGLATCRAEIEVSSSGGTAQIGSYCSAAYITGTLSQGQDASGSTLTLEPDVTQAGTYDISATKNGVTFSASGTFATTGCQTIVLNAVGSPLEGGTTTWTTNTVPSASASATVGVIIPSNISLRQDQKHIVASLYDEDYIPYTTPTGPASTATVPADGTPDLLVDVQYTFTTGGVEINIPVASASGSGTLPAYSQTVQVPANLTEDGVARDLELSWQSQSYTNATDFIEAKITAIGGNLMVKKLDINAGIGNDYRGVLLASFLYPYDNAGNTTTFEVRAMSGILDRYFGVVMNANGGNPQAPGPNGPFYHDFIYLPVTGAAGRTWLNQNLGSNYSNTRHAAFNPTQGPKSLGDPDAIGSKFQWGRQADGHELVGLHLIPRAISNRGNQLCPGVTTIGTSKEGYTCVNSAWSSTSWISNNNPHYWNPNGDNRNNPCPEGFYVPSVEEFQEEWDAAYVNIGSLFYQWETFWFGSPLEIVTNGPGRNFDSGNNVWKSVGTDFSYWTSSSGPKVFYAKRGPGTPSGPATSQARIHFGVRCIKEE